jgi:hypothetical protein
MTDLEHADISRHLALAIGWTEDQEDPDVVVVTEWHGHKSLCQVWADGHSWRDFDYRDPEVIWPIAERFNAFPWRVYSAKPWYANADASGPIERADTAALAVALAVIKAKEQP